MPAAMRASLEIEADVRRQTVLFARGFLVLAAACAVLITAFLAIVRLIDHEPVPEPLVIAGVLALALAAGAVLAAVGMRNGYKRMRARAAAAADHLRRGTCEQVRLDLPADHLVVDNDDQYFCFFPLGDNEVFFADVGGHEDDPRLAAHARGALFRATWWWKRLPGNPRPWTFETGGEPIPRVIMVAEPDGADKDVMDELGLDRWPADGEIVSLPARKLAALAAKWRRTGPAGTA